MAGKVIAKAGYGVIVFDKAKLPWRKLVEVVFPNMYLLQDYWIIMS
jgi:hypothetical protein